MLKNLSFITKIILVIFFLGFYSVCSAVDPSVLKELYKKVDPVEYGTFIEYGNMIERKYSEIKSKWNSLEESEQSTIKDSHLLNELIQIIEESYKYLPESNYDNKNAFISAINKLQNEYTRPNYNAIGDRLKDYVYNKIDIDIMEGEIRKVDPGFAPYNVTFETDKVSDPTGTEIFDKNYTWRVKDGENGQRKILGHGPSLNYTFKTAGNYTVFLDITSNNKEDHVLPVIKSVKVEVKSEIAKMRIFVNGLQVQAGKTLKFGMNAAKKGLAFDASSSTPTGNTNFVYGKWEFSRGQGLEKEEIIMGEKNGANPIDLKAIKKEYDKAGKYNVKLTLITNKNEEVSETFLIEVGTPIASIDAQKDYGYIGDKLTFKALTPSENGNNTEYNWSIQYVDESNTGNTYEYNQKTGKNVTYDFGEKADFRGKGTYKINLTATNDGRKNTDYIYVYIYSRPPHADFKISQPFQNRKGTIELNGLKSTDSDPGDKERLTFKWNIDGKEISLSKKNSQGYYTFDETGEHTIKLIVTDPSGVSSEPAEKNITINDVSFVDFTNIPEIAKIDTDITFTATGSNGATFVWTFGDGDTQYTNEKVITHKYKKSGIYNVSLKTSQNGKDGPSITKKVYVSSEDEPIAKIEITDEHGNTIFPDEYGLDQKYCEGVVGAYIIRGSKSIKLKGDKSVNTKGDTSLSNYTWKVGAGNGEEMIGEKVIGNGNDKIKDYSFIDLGCYKVKLTVQDGNKAGSEIVYVDVQNAKPSLVGLEYNEQKSGDYVVINVKAIGAEDEDGAIISYTWYYYTDDDPEPKDIRVTTKPETTFQIPEIAGNYYFVVVLKDNNEEIFSSEDLGKKTIVPISSNSTNIPILTNCKFEGTNETKVGEGKKFYCNVKNTIDIDITSDCTFYRDCDGDGFFDIETKESDYTCNYDKPGDYKTKVKVKYNNKFSSKIFTIKVKNDLQPNFDYISIYNRFIFINKSLGKYNDASWNLGDGNDPVFGTGNFVYDYTDGSSEHEITLTIMQQGTENKSITKTIENNINNGLKYELLKENGQIIIFSYPEMDENNTIILKNRGDKAYIYLGLNQDDNIFRYGIDYDIDYDSGLNSDGAGINGLKDDDIDNRNEQSYIDGSLQEITLNNIKTQKGKITLFDSTHTPIGEPIEITIIKEYILDEIRAPITQDWEGLSDYDKERIDKIEELLNQEPQLYKLEGMNYLEELKKSRDDRLERTTTIHYFQSFIDNINVRNRETILILSSELINGEPGDETCEEDTDCNALKNLIPDDIKCEYDNNRFNSCRDYLLDLIEQIKKIDNDEKKETKEKLEKEYEIGMKLRTAYYNGVIGTKHEDKKDVFYSTLSYFVKNITSFDPDCGNGIVDEGEQCETTDKGKTRKKIIKGEISDEIVKNCNIKCELITQEPSSLGKYLKYILYVFVGIAGLILLVLLIKWLLYKISNKDKNKTFEDYLLNNDTNSAVTNTITETQNQIQSDILNETTTTETTIQTENQDILNEQPSQEEPLQNNDGKVPDWLKASFDGNNSNTENTNTETSQTTNQVNIENNQTNITNETNIYQNENIATENSEVNNISSDNNQTNLNENISETSNISQNENQINQNSFENSSENTENFDDEPEIPDWLKNDSDENSSNVNLVENIEESNVANISQNETSISSNQNEVNLNENPAENSEISDDEPEIPDWLKNDLDEKVSDQNIETSNISQDENQTNLNENISENSNISQNENQLNQNPFENNSSENTTENFDDEPEIPDWLKNDSDENISEKNSENLEDENISQNEDQASLMPSDTSLPIEENDEIEENLEENENDEFKTENFEETEEEEEIVEKQDDNLEDENIETEEEEQKEEIAPKTRKGKAKTSTTSKKSTSTKKEQSMEDDFLWQDGMEVPDWLEAKDEKKKIPKQKETLDQKK